MLVLLFTRSLSGKFSRSRGVQRQSSRNTSAYFSYCEIPSPCGKTNLETAPVFPRRRLRLQFLLEELVAETKTFRARHQIRNWVPLRTWPCTRLRHNVPASVEHLIFDIPETIPPTSYSDSIGHDQRGVFGASVYASGPEIVSSKTIDGERGIPNVSEKNCIAWNSPNELPSSCFSRESVYWSVISELFNSRDCWMKNRIASWTERISRPRNSHHRRGQPTDA